MTRAKPPCERPDDHHSDDRVLVWWGHRTPMILCGKHAQDIGASIRAVRASVDIPQHEEGS